MSISKQKKVKKSKSAFDIKTLSHVFVKLQFDGQFQASPKGATKRSDKVYASVWNPATTKLGVHGVVLFLFPLNGPLAEFYGLSYLLPLPGRGVHIYP